MQLLFCSIAYRDTALRDLIAPLAEIGYDGIEVFGRQVEKATDDELCSLRQSAKDHNIALPVVSPYFVLTRGQAEYDTTIETAKRFVHVAHLLGCNKIRTFTDVAQGVASSAATEAHWSQCVRGLQTICDMDPAIQFVVETHPLTLADTVPSTLKLLQRVGRPNLKVNFQPNDFFFAFGLFEAFDTLRPHITHIHLSQDTPTHVDGYVETPGRIDMPAFFSHLRKSRYDGTISVEYCWKDVPRERAKSAHTYLRPLMK